MECGCLSPETAQVYDVTCNVDKGLLDFTDRHLLSGPGPNSIPFFLLLQLALVTVLFYVRCDTMDLTISTRKLYMVWRKKHMRLAMHRFVHNLVCVIILQH